MNSKLVRSSTPHSVTFNEVTHNATSPNNDLKSGDKKEVAGEERILIDDAQQLHSARVKFEDEGHLSSHHAKFDSEAIGDQTSTGGPKSHIRTNRQTFADDVFVDNMQPVSSPSSYVNHKVYLEKKNIHDQLVHVQTSEPATAPDQSNLQVEDAAESAMAQKNSDIPTAAMNESLDMVEEDPLQAQIRLMKKKLRKANQTLVDIQAQDSGQQNS